MTTSAKLPIGTAIRTSYERLRTVADGCDHKRNVERTHPQPPDPQSETGTLATHSGRQNKQKRLWFVDASGARKFLVASLYPMKKLTDSNERLQALAAAESHFDATLRDMLQGKHRPLQNFP